MEFEIILFTITLIGGFYLMYLFDKFTKNEERKYFDEIEKMLDESEKRFEEKLNEVEEKPKKRGRKKKTEE